MLPDLDPSHINHGSDQGRVEYQLKTNYNANEASVKSASKSVNPTGLEFCVFLLFKYPDLICLNFKFLSFIVQ